MKRKDVNLICFLEKYNRFGSKALKAALLISAFLFLQNTADAQTFTQAEQQCFNMVKGKVAYNQKGDTDWSDVNIRSLCNGTTEPAATIDCFKSKLSLVDNWNYAVNECAPHRLNSVSTQNAGRTVAVYRWFHPGDKDWLTITQNELSDSQLQQYGYRDKTVQFYGLTAQTSDTVAVYRWFHPGNKDWLTIAEGEISEDQLRQYGYRDKKFQFYAYKTPRPNTEAVFRWFHPGNKDWLTVRNSEFFDSQLKQKGYTDKKLQFYALTSPNVLNTSNDSTSMPTPNNAGSNETSVLDLSGKWIVTRTAGDGADYDVSIAHSGANFTLTVNGTVLKGAINGDKFVVEGLEDVGTIANAGNRIRWQNGDYWERAGGSPMSNSSVSNVNSGGTETNNLSGNWVGYYSDGTKSPYVWTIHQTGSTLTFEDVGAGSNTKFSGRIAGDKISDSLNKTGTLSADGKKINWSDGVVWVKQ